MQIALDEAIQARGYTRPNPMVGCVIVKSGEIAGLGYHQRAGTAHAEVHALEHAGERAKGSTVFVTLEPCCHDGPGKRTPPCVPQLINAGVAGVVIAMLDPNPQVAGKGVAQLEAAGIKVTSGVLEAQARAMNPGYLSLIERNRPWITAKWAMTLDGKIATRTGASRWISGEDSRVLVHAERACSACVLTGIGTVLADDPLLTARPLRLAQPLRAVIDPNLDIPLESQIVRTAREVPTLIFCAPFASAAAFTALTERGIEVLQIKSHSEGQGERSHLAWDEILAALTKRKCGEVFLEAGGGVLASALAAKVIDEAMVFVAPKLFGGRDAITPLEGEGIARIEEAPTLTRLSISQAGNDAVMRGLIRYPDAD